MNTRRLAPFQSGSAAGTLLTLLFIAALIGLGVYLLQRDGGSGIGGLTSGPTAVKDEGTTDSSDVPVPIEPLRSPPTLDLPAAYTVKDQIVEIDISEYAGYAGLIAANGGLAANPDSYFTKEFGFQVKLTLSEGENWSQLNHGRFAASATTTDVLAVLGRQFQVRVPVLLSFSRGADQVVVDTGIANINQLKGKRLAASQFNESEFFIRFLAREAGLTVKVLRDLDGAAGPGELGLVFYEDAFKACDAYGIELTSGKSRLNGCVGWTPRTEEVVGQSGGRAKVLVSNRNLLIVSDILTVNGEFAAANPQWVRGIVQGVLEGNRRLTEQPAEYLSTVAKAFGWSEEQARGQLKSVHFANLPENLAFFAGTIDAAGSFGSIYQSAVLAYGGILKNTVDSDRFMDTSHLEAIKKAGLFAGQSPAIAPIRGARSNSLEGDPLLSKDIRFFFEPNSSQLDRNAKENADYLDTIKGFLQVSPGSTVLLRGHVDDARVPEFRKQGGEKMVQTMALQAMELSKARAGAVRDALLKRHPTLDTKRLEIIGRGWEEPTGNNSDLNRRVEAQWFTLE